MRWYFTNARLHCNVRFVSIRHCPSVYKITTDKTVLFCQAFGLETEIASVERRIEPTERQIRLYASFYPPDESGAPLYSKVLSTTTSFYVRASRKYPAPFGSLLRTLLNIHCCTMLCCSVVRYCSCCYKYLCVSVRKIHIRRLLKKGTCRKLFNEN